VVNDRDWMSIDVHPAESIGHLVDYLHRLGCCVERSSPSRLSVSVAFPETVEDERASLREWCESWSGGSRTAALAEELESV
jgi:hypothetical protein